MRSDEPLMEATTLLGVIAAALLAVFLTIKFPKSFIFAAVWFIMLEDTIQWLFKLEWITYTDEVVTALAALIFPLGRLMSKRRLVRIPGMGWIVLFVLAGSIGNALNHTPADVFVLGTGSALKGLVFAFAVAQLDWTPRDIQRSAKYFFLIGTALVITGAVNLVAPGPWAQVFSPSGNLDYRFGIPSLIGPFVHPGIYATVLGLISIAALSYRRTVRKSRASAFLAFTTAVGSLLGMRRRLWAAAAMAWAGLLARTSTRATAVLVTVLAVPAGILVSGDFFSSIFGSISREYLSETGQASAARTVLSLGAVDVANLAIPFGAGFGRYASWVAALRYSPEYVARGFDHIWGLTPLERGSSNFLLDTFWPAVIGETGWLGLLAFIGLVLSIIRMFYKLSAKTESRALARCVGVTGFGWMLFILFDSVAGPSFYNPLYMILYAIIGVGSHLYFAKPASSPAVGNALGGGAAGNILKEDVPAADLTLPGRTTVRRGR